MRDSNEQSHVPNDMNGQQLTSSGELLSGHCQDCRGIDCHSPSPIDTRLKQINDVWSTLSEQVKERIVALLSTP